MILGIALEVEIRGKIEAFEAKREALTNWNCSICDNFQTIKGGTLILQICEYNKVIVVRSNEHSEHHHIFAIGSKLRLWVLTVLVLFASLVMLHNAAHLFLF